MLHRAPQRLWLFCAVISAGLTAASVTWGVVLLVVVPRGFGAWLLGPIWQPAYPLILPQMLFVTGQAIASGAGMGLHALGAARRSLRVAIISSVLLVACSLAGASRAEPPVPCAAPPSPHGWERCWRGGSCAWLCRSPPRFPLITWHAGRAGGGSRAGTALRDV